MTPILVAGIGNIFCGDDAFGVEVVQQFARRAVPEGVRVMDAGIRGLHLAYALLDGYRAAILVDTAQRGGPPGTLYVIEPETDDTTPAEPPVSAHSLDPARVLDLVRSFGESCPRIRVLACEPLTFGGEEGAMGLSAPVAAAVGPALAMLDSLIGDLLHDETIAADQHERSLT